MVIRTSIYSRLQQQSPMLIPVKRCEENFVRNLASMSQLLEYLCSLSMNSTSWLDTTHTCVDGIIYINALVN